MGNLKNEEQYSNADESIVLIEGISMSDGVHRMFTLGNSGDTHCIVNTKGKHKEGLKFLRKMCEDIVQRYSFDDLEISILDCVDLTVKRAMASDYLAVGDPEIPINTFGVNECKDAIEELCKQASARYVELQNTGFRSVADYNKDARCFSFDIMPRKLILIWAADILFKEKDTVTMNSLKYLEKIGRIIGIHLIYVIEDNSVVTDSDVNFLCKQCSLRFMVDTESPDECFVAKSYCDFLPARYRISDLGTDRGNTHGTDVVESASDILDGIEI